MKRVFDEKQRDARRRQRSRSRDSVPLLFILGLFLALRVADPSALEMLRNSGHDLFQGIVRDLDAEPGVVVVHIDERSLAAKGPWPWPRDRVAGVVDAVADAGARTVVLVDLFESPDRFGPAALIDALPEPLPGALARELEAELASSRDPDLALAASLRRVAAVVATSVSSTRPESAGRAPLSVGLEGSVIESQKAFAGLAVAIPPLRDAAVAEGAVNLFPERDMILRRVPTVFLVDGAIHPALPVAAVMASGRDVSVVARQKAITGLRIGDRFLETDVLGRLWLDYTRMSRIPILSASAVAADPGALEGRVAVIGVDATGVSARARVANGELASGPEIIAATIDGILTDTVLARPAYVLPVELAAVAGLGCAVIVFWLWSSPIWAIVLTIGACLAWVATVAVCRWQLGLVIDPLTPVTVAVLMAAFSAFSRALSLARERERLIIEQLETEQRLLQAQKMEAVGELTSGIAHDFNNLLAVIHGNLELVKRRVEDAQMTGMIEAALRSVRRGTNLIKQLLLFSRKAELAPQVADLSGSLTAMGDMIRVSLPAAVEFEPRYSDDLWPVKLDEDQFASAILNLVINAKDAMPGGGKVTIETANVTITPEDLARFTGDIRPGRYVRVTVGDTGEGMPPDVVARAFDPFFTTKSVGKGTGLGLPMVHGFVRQSGGDVLIESAPGSGTRILLHFPAGEAEAAEDGPAEQEEMPRSARGERILVAEDQADVRRVVTAYLTDLGYEVVEASDGETALGILQGDARIDLLLTDMAMPGSIQGAELADRARGLVPGVRVVFITGYPKGVDMEAGQASGRAAQITKPVSQKDLAKCIWSELQEA